VIVQSEFIIKLALLLYLRQNFSVSLNH